MHCTILQDEERLLAGNIGWDKTIWSGDETKASESSKKTSDSSNSAVDKGGGTHQTKFRERVRQVRKGLGFENPLEVDKRELLTPTSCWGTRRDLDFQGADWRKLMLELRLSDKESDWQNVDLGKLEDEDIMELLMYADPSAPVPLAKDGPWIPVALDAAPDQVATTQTPEHSKEVRRRQNVGGLLRTASEEAAALRRMVGAWGLSPAGVEAICAARVATAGDAAQYGISCTALLAAGSERKQLESALGSKLSPGDWKTVQKGVARRTFMYFTREEGAPAVKGSPTESDADEDSSWFNPKTPRWGRDPKELIGFVTAEKNSWLGSFNRAVHKEICLAASESVDGDESTYTDIFTTSTNFESFTKKHEKVLKAKFEELSTRRESICNCDNLPAAKCFALNGLCFADEQIAKSISASYEIVRLEEAYIWIVDTLKEKEYTLKDIHKISKERLRQHNDRESVALLPQYACLQR